MSKKRKRLLMAVTVSVPASMSAQDARREVRHLITNQCNYAADSSDVTAVKVTPPAKPASVIPPGLGTLLSNAIGAIQSLQLQVDQMSGMFDDADGAIKNAYEEGDEAAEKLDAFRKEWCN